MKKKLNNLLFGDSNMGKQENEETAEIIIILTNNYHKNSGKCYLG
jgi:hypothetical protein